jgi:hypothetical protein
LAAGWSWEDAATTDEQVYGALLVARDNFVPISRVIEMLPPLFWATGVSSRGCIAEDVGKVEEAFGRSILSIKSPFFSETATTTTLRVIAARRDQRASTDIFGHHLQLFSRMLAPGTGVVRVGLMI